MTAQAVSGCFRVLWAEYHVRSSQSEIVNRARAGKPLPSSVTALLMLRYICVEEHYSKQHCLDVVKTALAKLEIGPAKSDPGVYCGNLICGTK